MPAKHRQFATFIKTHREAAGLTPAELARAVRVSKPTVHYWEAGKVLPQVTILETLAQALKVSYEDLFVKAGYDRETLPSPEPYFRLMFPGASDRKLDEAKRLFEQAEASERRKKGRQ